MADVTKVSVSRSIFSRPRGPTESRKQKHQQFMNRVLEKDNPSSTYLHHFKVLPLPDVDETETRPLAKCCKNCAEDSSIDLDVNVKYLGLVDCFYPPTLSAYNSRLVQLFPFYSHYARNCNFAHLYNLPSMKDLERMEPQALLQGCKSELDAESQKVYMEEIVNVLRNIQVTPVWKYLLNPFIRISAWFCQKYLALHFESVWVHGGQIELLKELHMKKLPIIYVPTCRSWLDTILILWTLAHHGLPTPLFIPGHNASKFTKYFGGIGATPRVKSKGDPEMIYSSAVGAYLTGLLRKKNSLLINLDIERSRTGRPSACVYGTEFLQIVYNEYLQDKIDDAYFVPVSISYESLPDMAELFQLDSKKKSLVSLKGTCTVLWKLLKSIFSFEKAKLGSVKIDFAQPVCLRALHTSLKKNVKIQRCQMKLSESYFQSREGSVLRWKSNESINSISSTYELLGPLYPADNDQGNKEALILDVVNYHLMYDAGKCESIMPTHLLAFVLLKRCRGGVYLDQLKVELQRLVDMVKSWKKDFGFNVRDCDMESIAVRAMEILSDDINCRWINEKKTFHIQAKNNLESLRRLNYYANYIIPHLMMEAVIATTIFALRGTQFKMLRGFNIELDIGDEEFITNCKRVYELFRCVFLLHPPCFSIEAGIRKYVMKLSDEGLLSLVMKDSRSYHWEDQSDDDYQDDKQDVLIEEEYAFIPEAVKILTSRVAFEKLNFLRSLANPYLEVFAFLTRGLKVLENDQDMQKNKMEKYLLGLLTNEIDGQFSHCRELVSLSTVKSFLVTFEDHGIIQCFTKPPGPFRVYILDPSWEGDLDTQADKILFYVTC